ncbi:MAG TPA: hypothetical protein VF635_01935 [Propionibacteriaceae bacterium]
MMLGAGADVFDEWLEDMHPQLMGFVDFALPKNVAKDFSRQSLADLEQYLLYRWPDQATFLAHPDPDFTDGAVRYIGETLLRACGGGWHFSDKPGFLLAGRPYLRLDTLDATPISPYHLMTALLKRRTGVELTKVFDAQVRRIGERREQEGPGWAPRRQPVPGITSGTDAEEAAEQARDEWVSELPDRLARVRARAGAEAARLDLSAGSLAVLEGLALADFATPDQLDVVERRETTATYVAYLGETLRREAGGQWVLRPGELGRNLYIGRPFLARTDGDGTRRTSVPAASLIRLVGDRVAGVFEHDLRTYAD